MNQQILERLRNAVLDHWQVIGNINKKRTRLIVEPRKEIPNEVKHFANSEQIHLDAIFMDAAATNGGFLIFGFDFSRHRDDLHTALGGLTLRSQSKQPFEDVLDNIRRETGQQLSLVKRIDSLELSINSAHQSHRSHTVWVRGGQAPETAERVRIMAPDMMSSFHSAIMLMGIWERPLESWLALQVSDGGDGAQAFSDDRYNEAVHALLE